MNTKHYFTLAGVAGACLIAAAPAQASRSDSRIENAAKNSYVFKTYLKNDSIDVKADHGVVTLTGSVANEGQKQMAEQTVASLPGVDNVNDQLVISAETHPSGSDALLELKVKSALLFDRGVSADVKVVARNGVVTLYGPAQSSAQRELVSQDVRDVDGVQRVDNQMTVQAFGGEPPETAPPPAEQEPRTLTEKVDDASVTAEAKITLLSHHSLEGSHIRVLTRRGVVILDGTAQTDAQKQLAERLVGSLRGVDRVIDHVSVQ